MINSTHDRTMIEFAEKLQVLIAEQSLWSQATFGSDADRGPVGALKHLSLEATEAAEQPDDITEYADCFLLILDASRRAGITPMQLVDASFAKLQVCKQREWSKPTDDEPVLHVERTTPHEETHEAWEVGDAVCFEHGLSMHLGTVIHVLEDETPLVHSYWIGLLAHREFHHVGRWRGIWPFRWIEWNGSEDQSE